MRKKLFEVHHAQCIAFFTQNGINPPQGLVAGSSKSLQVDEISGKLLFFIVRIGATGGIKPCQ